MNLNVKIKFQLTNEEQVVYSDELETINLEAISAEIVKNIYRLYPKLTQSNLARILGISERTLYRWKNKYNVSKPKDKLISYEKTIAKLEKAGYIVTKKEEKK